MDTITKQRSDQQLEGMLSQTNGWLVMGLPDEVIAISASLRLALQAAREQSALQTPVHAIVRAPAYDVIIFPNQMRRMWQLMDERAYAPIQVQQNSAASS